MREYVATAKTVEEAIQLGCEALSVDSDDLGVSYEILEMPQKTGFLQMLIDFFNRIIAFFKSLFS